MDLFSPSFDFGEKDVVMENIPEEILYNFLLFL